MRRRSRLLLAASWLVVRLRLSLLSSQLLLRQLLAEPAVMLVSRRADRHAVGCWHHEQARSYFVHIEAGEERIQIRALPARGLN